MNDTLRVVIAIGIIVVCVILFIGTYILNKRTPKPEGCQEIGSECEGCQITSCSHYKKPNIEEKEK